MADFVDRIIDDFIEAMEHRMGCRNIFILMLNKDAVSTFFDCATFMREHLAFVRAMTGSNGTPLFRERISTTWTAQLQEALVESVPDFREHRSFSIVATYVVSSMWGLLEYEINGNMKYNDEYMASQFAYLLCECTLSKVVGDLRGDVSGYKKLQIS